MKIFLWGAMPIFLAGLRQVLSQLEWVEIVGEQADDEVLRTTEPFDVLVACNALSSAVMKERFERLDDREYVVFLLVDQHFARTEVLDLMRFGVKGVVSRACSFREITTALSVLKEGQVYFDRRVADIDILKEVNESANTEPNGTSLTDREKQVLRMLAEGYSVKEIANELDLSLKTVEAHKFNLMRKLDIHNKALLVQYAIRNGYIKLSA